MPVRHPGRLAGRGGDHDLGVGDLRDAPRGRAEDEGVARPALVDHLFVELTDAVAVGEKDAEQPAVGDRAAVGDRDPTRAVARANTARGAVPHDAWTEARELIGRVPAGEEVEDGDERVVGQVGEGRGAADHGLERVDVPLVDGAGRDDLLGQDVEGVPQIPGLFDQPGFDARDDRGRFEQVAAVLREDAAPTRLAHVVTGASDPLQAP